MRLRFATRKVAITVLAAGVLGAFGPIAYAQVPGPAQLQLPAIPVRIDVVLSRYQGEKKVSSMPFSLMSNPPGAHQDIVNMRMGVDVPVGSTTSNRSSSSGPATQTTTTAVEYRNIGTNIDCYIQRVDDTHFSVNVSISDSSVYSPDGASKSLKLDDPMAFRTLSTRNTATFRDGQTILFGTMTDKVTGEILKIEVTLSVLK